MRAVSASAAPDTESFRSDTGRFLVRAEQAISVLSRSTPCNARSEIERLADAWQRGDEAEPDFRYAPAPDLSELREVLMSVAARLESGSRVDQLGAERARELSDEAALVETRGTPRFATLAAHRFPSDR